MTEPARPVYAEVALPVPLDQAFTYRVPEGRQLAPGQRVRVPWARQALVGVVLEVREQPPAGIFPRSIRTITRILDAEPILDPPLLEMGRWVAAYYQTPIGEALRCALPPPVEVRERRRLQVTEAGRAWRAAQPPALFNQADDAALLAGIGDGLARSTAVTRFGALAVRAALRRGWLSEAVEIEERAALRAVAMVSLTDLPLADQKLTQRQRAVLERLQAAPDRRLPAAELAAISAGAVAALCRRGILRRVAVEQEPEAPRWAARPRVRELNAGQQAAVAAIAARLEAAAEPRVVLLHGVTGSGKTAVYLESISACLRSGGGALLLVPEIGLTPAVFADFEQAFPGQVSILHSSLTNAERAQHWHRLRAGISRVAIGTRSAVFAPVPALKLIIVDEEHDASFKQQESPRYHGRDLAVLRGNLQGAAVVLGSATPSLESWINAQAGKYALVTMAERVERRPLPRIRLLDMAEEFRRKANGVSAHRAAREHDCPIATELIAAVEERLSRGEQAMLLINRRGYSPVVLCRKCGKTVGCRDCDLSLTYHKRLQRLRCHLCGFDRSVPQRCPDCDSEHLYFLGAGSEKIEERLAAIFPRARIARLDRDTTQGKHDFAEILAAFRQRQYDLLVGTQMIAKGHDMPAVTLVGVIHADLGITFPDFRAAERTFQLLTQVAGRAGRGELPGEVLLQVLHPGHYAVQAAATANPQLFYEKETNFRRWLHYPPFAALALVQVRHANAERALELTRRAGALLQPALAGHDGLKLLGPAPAPVARIKTEYRYQFLLKSESRRTLQTVLAHLRRGWQDARLPATALIVDVDPIQLS